MSNPFAKIESVNISVDNSSLVTGIEWAKSTKGKSTDPKGSLTLTFIKGERYEYVNVPSTVVQEMLLAESIGKYFHTNIKDQYDTYKEI